MTRVLPAWSRRPADDYVVEHTLGMLGDQHWGANVVGVAQMDTRAPMIRADMQRITVPTPPHTLALGDLVNDGLVSQRANALPWMASLPSAVHPVLGNHDLNGVNSAVDTAAYYGMPAPSYTIDIGFATVAVLGPRELYQGRMAFDQSLAAWVDSVAQAASGDVILAAHNPLWNTIARSTDQALEYTSTTPSFPFQFDSLSSTWAPSDDAALRTVIADNPNIKLFLSGHTHTPTFNPEFLTVDLFGGRKVGSVNGSCTLYVGLGQNIYYSLGSTPMQTCYLTKYDTDVYELRVRDHGRGVWGSFYDPQLRVWPIDLR